MAYLSAHALSLSLRPCENFQVANATFQAAAPICDAAIREWGFCTDDEKRSLMVEFYRDLNDQEIQLLNFEGGSLANDYSKSFL